MSNKPLIILSHPQMGENIGAAGRVMGNFGLDGLRLVAPRDGWPDVAQRQSPEKPKNSSSLEGLGAREIDGNPSISLVRGQRPQADAWGGVQHTKAHANYQKAYAMGTGAKAIEHATIHPTLEDAIADCHGVYATTARHRRLHLRMLDPRQAAAEMHQRIHAGERIAILFGPERSGLENDELVQADAAVTIPVDAHFPSLNLAQAVGVMAYEWAVCQSSESGVQDSVTQESALSLRERARVRAQRGTAEPISPHPTPRPEGGGVVELVDKSAIHATKQELNALFAHLEHELDAHGFFTTPERKPPMVQSLRALLQRTQLTTQDVQTLRGVISSLTRR